MGIFMKKQLKHNIKQRYSFRDNEKKRLILKIISKNLKLKRKVRWKALQKFFDIMNITSPTRIKNICTITGRTKSVYRLFKLSRIQLRELASNGKLPSVSKYSW